MLLAAVRAPRQADDEAVVEMAPVIGCGVRRIDAERLDRVDCVEDSLDFWPTADAQQDVAARANEGQRLIGFAAVDRAHDVDARDDRAEIVGSPAHEREDVVRRETEHAAATIEDRLASVVAETDPVLDTSFKPGQLDVRQHRSGVRPRRAAGVGIGCHERSPSESGNSRANRSRSMSATVTPRWKAAILMRPRSAGVMSTVSRAV